MSNKKLKNRIEEYMSERGLTESDTIEHLLKALSESESNELIDYCKNKDVLKVLRIYGLIKLDVKVGEIELVGKQGEMVKIPKEVELVLTQKFYDEIIELLDSGELGTIHDAVTNLELRVEEIDGQRYMIFNKFFTEYGAVLDVKIECY